MSVIFKSGNIFAEPVEAIINTVNCVGVMGKGIALEFKKIWPENYKEYKKLCDSKQLRPGVLFVYEQSDLFDYKQPRYLVNFPTKVHWRSKSRIEYIELGLDALIREIRDRKIRSIAVPPLGCGNGGLDWPTVRCLIQEKLSSVNGCEIIVFEHTKTVKNPEYKASKLPMNYQRATLLKALAELDKHFDGSFDRISLQKIVYFLQALGVDFKLQFQRNANGPYSGALKSAFQAFERYGLISGFSSPEKMTQVTESGYALGEEYLKSSRQSDDAEEAVQKLDKLIQGYESPYGLELLSSVHWLSVYENLSSEKEIVGSVLDWNIDKRNKFSPANIAAAYKRLQVDGLLI